MTQIEPFVHDPYVDHWWEFRKQDEYPVLGNNKSVFFRNQEKLKDIKVEKDLSLALKNKSAVIFAVRHEEYLHLDPVWVIQQVGKPTAIIDCFCILSDDKIKSYLEMGCEVKALGRGHIQRIKKEISNNL